jgi:hypothetical protein
MTQAKHTPGPWFQHEGEVIAAEYGLISRAYYGHPDSQNAANARLIAAAPELLEALKGMVNIAKTGMVDFNPHDEYVMDNAVKVITKATVA